MNIATLLIFELHRVKLEVLQPRRTANQSLESGKAGEPAKCDREVDKLFGYR